MKLNDETIGYHQEFDIGPVLGSDAGGNDVLLKDPPTITIDGVLDAAGSPAPPAIFLATVVPYAGPKPPTDPVVATEFQKAIALGATEDEAYAAMVTVRAAGQGVVGFKGTVHIADPQDVPGEDTFVLSIGSEAAVGLSNTQALGGVREQAAA